MARWFPTLLLLAWCLSPTPLLAHPGSGIALDAKGRVYFVDTGGGLFRIDGPGRMTRLPGPALHWMALDAQGRFAQGKLPQGGDWELRTVGSDPALILSSDFPVAVVGETLLSPRPGPDGRIRIHALAPDGRETIRTTLALRSEPLRWLGGLAAGPDGALFFTEGNAVRRLAADGSLSTLAEIQSLPGCVQPPGYEPASGRDLRGLAVGKDGTVTVAASGCSAVLRISPKGKTTVLLRAEAPWSPTAVAVDGGSTYVLEYTHTPGDDRRQWLPRVRKVGPDGQVSVLAAVASR